MGAQMNDAAEAPKAVTAELEVALRAPQRKP